MTEYSPLIQGYYASSGIILRRRVMPDGDLLIDLFLKNIGRLMVSARKAAQGKVRFGGATEPFVCGVFILYKSRGSIPILSSIDVKDDLLSLRSSKEIIKTSMEWSKMLRQYLEEFRPDNPLLSCLYWSLKLLQSGITPSAVDWRYLWRWLKLWGLAPDLEHCCGCGENLTDGYLCKDGFQCKNCSTITDTHISADELTLLRIFAESGKEKLFDFGIVDQNSINLFHIVTKRYKGILNVMT